MSASILIVSALLLSGARNVTAKSPSQPNQSTQTPTEEHSSVPSPSVSPLNQPTAAATAKPTATYIYNQYKQASPWGNVPTWLEAIATILLVIFAGRQLSSVKGAANAARDNADAAKDAAVSTKRYVEMTEQTVEAANQSARAAELALNIERPYVFIEKQSLALRNLKLPSGIAGPFSLLAPESIESEATHKGLDPTFILRNRGKGIAIIRDVRLRVMKVPYPALLSGLPVSTGKFEVIARYSYLIQQPVLGNGEMSDPYSALWLRVPIDVWREASKIAQRQIVLTIRVAYSDAAERPFFTIQRFNYVHGNLYAALPRRRKRP